MFGDRYFSTRKRLTDVVSGVYSLGSRVGAEVSALADEREYLKGLQSPFLFVVCGEVNAGKSSLLNGLFGEDLCRANVLPETDRVYWYRYGKEAKEVEVTPVLQQRFRSVDFLKDFHLVDTPGTNSVQRGHEDITRQFIPVADLILFVFPVSNPWGAATWSFIERMEPELQGKIAIVLQLADLREEADLEVILEHMRDLAKKKLGSCPPILAVSAKKALAARSAYPFHQRLWEESGFEGLEALITERVMDSPARKRVLRDVRDSTQLALGRIEAQIELNAAQLEKDMSFLRELEMDVDRSRESQAHTFSGKFTGLSEVFAAEGRKMKHHLAEKMSVLSSILALFRAERTPSEIEQALVEAVTDAVQVKATEDGHELVERCRGHWEMVAPKIEARLDIKAPNFSRETGELKETRDRFVARMGRAARQAVAMLKIRSLLDMQMEARRNMLRRYVCGALVAVIIAGVFGAFGQLWAAWGLIALAVLLFGVGGLQAYRSGKELCRVYLEKINACREPFAEGLSNDYREGVRDFFTEYTGLFESVRHHIAAQKVALKPQLEEWNGLFLELKGIEQIT